ncbi:MAG: hypothetical protein HQL75_01535 [Magnetococcales bacterium]|nr:hypothetical protein [Magnetococcales bacterium]
MAAHAAIVILTSFMGIFLASPVWAAPKPPPFTLTGPELTDKCVSCHAWRQPDLTPRTLIKPHETMNFTHWPQPGPWCERCHDPQEPYQLTLHHDQTIPLSQATILCAQCHGRKVTDWQFGIHGKRSGRWQGERQIHPCSTCHNPHEPAWLPLAPSTPPAPPGTQQPWHPLIPVKTPETQP